jgi:DNA-binding MarR family transcriptional regulator
MSSERYPERPPLQRAVLELFGAERRLRRRILFTDQLTAPQLRALLVLADGDPMTAGQVAKDADLNPASTSAVLKYLEENAIVERGNYARDRRVSMVSLTDTGRDIVAEKRARWDALWDEHMGDLSTREVALMTRGLAALTKLLDSM